MIIKVRAIPNADRPEIVSRIGSKLRIKLPVCNLEDDKANKLLIKFVADFFEVKPKYVKMRRGQRGREKTIEIDGRSDNELRELLDTIP